MGEFNTVDDFLNHKGSEGGGGKRLKGWAKDPGYMNWWNHTKQMPCSVWYHRIPELVVRDDKDDRSKKLKNVWGRQHACWEDETILKKQRFRAADGTREHPPTKCILCRLMEAIRELIADGKIEDTDVLFEFTGSDKQEEDKRIHAGGMVNLWNGDKMSSDDKERLKNRGIYMSKVWDENAVAKLSYVFAGVNHDAVSEGLQIAIQTQLLGDKVKRTIRNEIASKDGDDGNPFIKPYCIRFVYKADEKKFDDKYDALRIDRLKLTPEIHKLITGERPDISRYTRKFNQKEMRAMLEKHATPLAMKVIPWDVICDVPDYDAKPEEEAPSHRESPAPAPARTRVEELKAPAADLDDPCDDCGAEMRKGQTKCGRCGAKYADDPVAAPAKPEPPKAVQEKIVTPPPTKATDPRGAVANDLADGVYDEDVPFD